MDSTLLKSARRLRRSIRYRILTSWVFKRFRQHLSFPYVARRMATYSNVDASVNARIAAMGRALNGADGASHRRN